MNARPSVMRMTKKLSMPYKLSPYYNYLQEKRQKINTEHVCALTQQQKLNDIVKEVVDSGVFIILRRKCRALFMVNKDHPYTPLLFKSMTEIRQEEIRHLVLYPRMIHPFSMFASTRVESEMLLRMQTYFELIRNMAFASLSRIAYREILFFAFWLYWDLFYTLMLLCFVFGILPYDMGLIRPYPRLKFLKVALDIITLLDITINFHRGYLNMTTVKVELKPKRVIIHYLKTYFIWDLVSCLPSALIYPAITWKFTSKINQTKWLSVLKFVRVHTMESAIEKFRLYYGLSSTIELICTLFIRCYVIVVFCMSLMYFSVQYAYIDKHNITNNEDFDLFLDTLFVTEMPRFELDKCIQEVEYLRILPKHVLNMVVATAQRKYFLPGDVVFKPRQDASSMFFVRIGSTALFDDKGWEVCHLEDGQIYGACAAVLGENRTHTLIAVSACEIFIIRRSGLMNALEAFPDLKQYVIDTALIKQEEDRSRSFIY